MHKIMLVILFYHVLATLLDASELLDGYSYSTRNTTLPNTLPVSSRLNCKNVHVIRNYFGCRIHLKLSADWFVCTSPLCAPHLCVHLTVNEVQVFCNARFQYSAVATVKGSRDGQANGVSTSAVACKLTQ